MLTSPHVNPLPVVRPHGRLGDPVLLGQVRDHEVPLGGRIPSGLVHERVVDDIRAGGGGKDRRERETE